MIPSLYYLCRKAIDEQLVTQASYLNEKNVILPTPLEQLTYTHSYTYEYDLLDRVNKKRNIGK